MVNVEHLVEIQGCRAYNLVDVTMLVRSVTGSVSGEVRVSVEPSELVVYIQPVA